MLQGHRMKRSIRTRQDLLDWLANNAPSMSVARAFKVGGSIIVLGAFRPVPNSNWPGWIVLARTRFRDYYVAVSVRPSGTLNAYLTDIVDWKDYDGVGSPNPLYAGDRPERAAILKQAQKFEIMGVNNAKRSEVVENT